MISARDIWSRARELRVPETMIERDYAQNWLLGHLASMNIALKGGTGIGKVYIENYRFSDDLDFTLLEKMDSVALNDLVGSAVLGARDGREIYIDNHIILTRPENVAICKLEIQDAISIQKGEKQTP